MKFELITLLGKKLDTEVYEVILPTADGEISVFPGHEPLVSLAVPGVISVRHEKGDLDEQLEYFATSGGIIEIDQQRVRVLVDAADKDEEIVEAEAKAALERAEKMKAEASDQVDIEKAHEEARLQTVRLQVAELRRRKKR